MRGKIAWAALSAVLLAGCATEGSRTVEVAKVEAAAAPYLDATGLAWLAVGPDGAVVSSPGAG